jgi:hypothetical protein
VFLLILWALIAGIVYLLTPWLRDAPLWAWALVGGILYPLTVAKERLEITGGFRHYGFAGIGFWIGKSIVYTTVFLVISYALQWAGFIS